jgi:hypothetical protein
VSSLASIAISFKLVGHLNAYALPRIATPRPGEFPIWKSKCRANRRFLHAAYLIPSATCRFSNGLETFGNGRYGFVLTAAGLLQRVSGSAKSPQPTAKAVACPNSHLLLAVLLMPLCFFAISSTGDGLQLWSAA